MIMILKVLKINGKVVEQESDGKEIENAAELEKYRKELEEKYGCEVEFVFRTI